MLSPARAEVPFPPLGTKEEVLIHESCPNKTHNIVTEEKDFRCVPGSTLSSTLGVAILTFFQVAFTPCK